MIEPSPVTLEGQGIRLEPLTPNHHDALVAAAADGQLWQLWFTTIPEPDGMQAYIDDALAGQAAGQMLP
ncbi:MAG: N-acetyltransferase, partial [Acidobacteriota bacterium]